MANILSAIFAGLWEAVYFLAVAIGFTVLTLVLLAIMVIYFEMRNSRNRWK